MARIREEIYERLSEAFNPSRLDVRDDSDRHRGHSGWRESGETHFHVVISSPTFKGMARLQRHRAIHAALSPVPMASIHALSLEILTD